MALSIAQRKRLRDAGVIGRIKSTTPRLVIPQPSPSRPSDTREERLTRARPVLPSQSTATALSSPAAPEADPHRPAPLSAEMYRSSIRPSEYDGYLPRGDSAMQFLVFWGGGILLALLMLGCYFWFGR